MLTTLPLKSASMSTSKPTIQHGGPRRGAGRPRKGEQPRVGLTFSVDRTTRDQARRLRSAGFPLGEHIESLVREKHSWYFNE